MNIHENPVCGRTGTVRDYAFDELAGAERNSMERHLAGCTDCAAELDQWRLTTAALRVLPDREIPQRIAFVADRAFGSNWLSGFRNSAARLGFASACVLAAGLSFASWHRQPPPQPAAQTAVSNAALREAVNKAVALAVDKAHADDVRMTKAALDAVDSKYAQKQRNLLVAMQEGMDRERKLLELRTSYAMLSDAPNAGARQ